MTAFLRRLLRLVRCTSGSALVEASIVTPVAIVLMAGGMDFGRIYWSASTADKSMRSAARYLARVPQNAVCDWGLTNAKKLAVYGTVTADPAVDAPLIYGWATSNVTLSQPSDCGTAPTIIQLTATVPFTGIMLGAVGLSNSITLNVQHEERWIGE